MRRSSLVVALLFAACGSSHGRDAGADTSTPGLDAGTSCAASADGTPCGSGRICLSEECVESVCGDGYVDEAAGEHCDDGNDVEFDGCPSTCEVGCSSSACDDAEPCNGVEVCDLAVNGCVAGEEADEGTACANGSVAFGACRGGRCVAVGCGNGFVDEGEHCDDGNTDDHDGCNNDCTAPD